MNRLLLRVLSIHLRELHGVLNVPLHYQLRVVRRAVSGHIVIQGNARSRTRAAHLHLGLALQRHGRAVVRLDSVCRPVFYVAVGAGKFGRSIRSTISNTFTHNRPGRPGNHVIHTVTGSTRELAAFDSERYRSGRSKIPDVNLVKKVLRHIYCVVIKRIARSIIDVYISKC